MCKLCGELRGVKVDRDLTALKFNINCESLLRPAPQCQDFYAQLLN